MATEYTCIIKEDGSGRYTSAKTWWANNECNLTANTTLVFAHGGTNGNPSDGSSVLGYTSGSSGTLKSCTNTQALVTLITGNFQASESVKVIGATQDNFTLSDTGDSAIAVGEIQGSWASPESGEWRLDGFVTNPTNYIKVYATGDAKHNGIYSATAWRIESISDGSAKNTVYIYTTKYAIFDGLQFKMTAQAGSSGYALYGATLNTNTQVYLNNCIIACAGNTTMYASGVRIDDADGGLLELKNCIVQGPATGTGNGITSTADYLNVYNSTIYGWKTGITESGCTTVYKNCAVFGNVTDFSNGDTIDYCASDDTAGTNYVDLKENAGGEWAASFSDHANGDFRIKDTNSLLYEEGTDLSGVGITDDIIGTSRPQNTNWDIGAFELIFESPPAASARRRMFIMG